MRRGLKVALMILTLLGGAGPALGVQPDEVMADPAQEARARGLSRDLRCMVCQNQSIDDSDAPLARDLRILVRERIAAGDTDAEVREFLVRRYGDFVLLKPPLRSDTALLWVLPPLMLAGGMLLLWINLRRRGAQLAPDSLSEAESADLARVLADEAASNRPQSSSDLSITKD